MVGAVVMRRAGIARATSIAGIGISTVPAASSAIMLWRIMCSWWWRLRWRSLWRLFVRRLLWILFVGIAIIAAVTLVVACVALPRFNRNAIQPRVAAIELGLALVTHLAQRKLLLILQVAADVGIFAIVLAALCQFVI
jgi:hypothetical protein